jgi:hypothetical protein
MTVEQFGTWEQVSADGTVQSMRIPGGTLFKLTETVQRYDDQRRRWDYEVSAVALCHVATAPHCQPTPPADDRPPMTDEALGDWLTATYGEPRVDGETQFAWETIGRPIVYHDTANETDAWDLWLDCANSTRSRHSLPAHIAGPALWAAHRYGTP